MRLYFTLALALLGLSGYAQTEGPRGNTTPALATTADEVVVTGTRLARPADRSPQRVTVIDSATVARAADFSQLLNEQAGIHINGAWSNPGKDRSVFLRNGANQYTLLLIDGQPLLDPSALGGAVDLRLLDLTAVERIEILRGGSSVLYGSDAVAGVINLVTRRGIASSSPTLHLRAAAQSYGTLEAGLSLRGGGDRLNYFGNFSYFKTNGISEALQPADAPTAFDKDGADRVNVNVGLNWQPADGLSVRPALYLASFQGDYDGGSFSDAGNSYTNDFALPSLAIDYERGAWTYGGRYSFAYTDREFIAAFPFKGRGRNHQADVFTVRDNGRGASLTLGTQYRHEGIRFDADNSPDRDMNTVSPYAQYALYTEGGFLADLGVRYNVHSEFGGQFNAALGLGYRITPVWSTRLNVGSAFQSPTLDQLAGPFGANEDLQPQVSTSYELSARLADPQGAYRLSLTGFLRNIDDVVLYLVSDEFPFGRYENAGELRDLGGEVEGRTLLGKNFTLNGNLTYVRGRQTSPDGTGGSVVTKTFFRRPRLTGALGLTYAPARPYLVRLSTIYTGERPDVFFDDNFARFETDLDPYFLAHLYAEYRMGERRNLTFFGEVRNFTDTDFVEVSGFSTQGRTVRAGVSVTL